MSAEQDIIAEAVMTHSRRIDPNHPGYSNCRCGVLVDLPQDHAGHLSSAVLSALTSAGYVVRKRVGL